MRVAIQSVCVTKILALQRWSKIDFPPEFQTRQMHSFPIMYNTMGSKVDGLAVRDHFLPKNGLKTAILGDTILDRLTSEGAGTQILKVSLTSACVLKNLEHYLRNELWARRQTSIVSEKQILTFLKWGDTKHCEKMIFFVKR